MRVAGFALSPESKISLEVQAADTSAPLAPLLLTAVTRGPETEARALLAQVPALERRSPMQELFLPTERRQPSSNWKRENKLASTVSRPDGHPGHG